MNDKDKEAFDEWLNKERRIFEANEPATFCDSDEFCMEKGWQAACEYKQNELSVIMEIDDNNKLKIHYLDADKQIQKLQNQNKILVGTLQDIANDRSPPWDKMDYQSKAREALKEI
jgi:hypothetical protein